MRVVLKFGFWWLMVPLAVLFLLLAFLVFTSWGARVSATLAEAFVPQLQIQQVDGSLAYGLRASHVRWQENRVTVDLNGVATVWNPKCLLKARFCVTSVAAGELDIHVKPGAESASASSAFQPLQLPLLLLPWHLELDQLYLARLRVEAGGTPVQVGPIALRASWSGTRVTVNALKAAMDDPRLGAVTAQLSGELDMRSEWPVRLTLDTHYVPPLEHWGAQQLHLSGKGNLRDLHLDANVAGTLQVPGLQTLQLDAGVTTLDLNTEVQLRKLTGSLKGTPLQAKGVLAFSHEGALDVRQLVATWGDNQATLNGTLKQQWNLNGALALAQPQLLAPDAKGRFDGAFTVTGDRADPLLGVKVASDSLDLPQVQIRKLQLQGEIKPVSFKQLTVDAQAESLTLADAPLQNVSVQLTGDAASHHLTFSGTSQDYQIAATVDGSLDPHKWDWQGNVEQLKLALGKDWALQLQQPVQIHWVNAQQRLQWSQACLADAQSRLCAKGDQWFARQQGGLDVEIHQFPVARLQRWLDGDLKPSGELNGRLQISGPWRDPLIEGPLRISALELRQSDGDTLLSQGNVELNFKQRQATLTSALQMPAGVHWANAKPLHIAWGHNRFSLDKGCWHVTRMATDKLAAESLGQACIGADADPRQGLQARAQLDLAVSPALQALLPGSLSMRGHLHLEASGKVKGHDAVGHLTARIENGALLLDHPDSDQPLAMPFQQLQLEADLAHEELTAHLNLASDRLGNGSASAKLNIRQQDPVLALQAHLKDLEVGFLRPLIPQLSSLSGKINGDLDVNGPLSGPRVTGLVALKQVQLQSALWPLGVDNLDARVTFDGAHGQLQGTLVSGGGNATLDGDFNLDGGGWNARVHLLGHNIPIDQPPDIKLELQPDLTVRVNSRQLQVTGKLAVTEGFLVLKPLPEDAVSVSQDVVFVDRRGNLLQQSYGIQTTADIQVSITPDVRIRGFGGEVRLKGTLQVSMDRNGVLIGRGNIDITDGSYTGYGQQLTIRKGQIIFNGPITQPFINIEAVRVVDTVTAGMRLTGPASEPRVTLFSEPSLPDSQILYYIITGKAPGTGTRDDNAMVQSALLSIGLRGGQPLARDIASKVGIEDLQMGASGSGDTTQVTVSGYINPRTYLQYGINVFQPYNTVTLRYRLGENLFLEAVSGLASALDLLYSFEF